MLNMDYRLLHPMRYLPSRIKDRITNDTRETPEMNLEALTQKHVLVQMCPVYHCPYLLLLI